MLVCVSLLKLNQAVDFYLVCYQNILNVLHLLNVAYAAAAADDDDDDDDVDI